MKEEISPLRLALAIGPGTLLAGVAGGIAFPILPIVGTQIGLSAAFIGVILAANRAVRLCASPFIGAFVDRFGARRTLLVGLAINIATMSLYALGMLAHHAGAGFLAGRVFHGFGSGCVFVSAQALALFAGGANRGGGSAGTVRAAIVLGVPIGLVCGGLLSDAIGPIATFGVAAASVVLALSGAFFTVPDLRGEVPVRASLRETVSALRDRRLFAVGALNFALQFAAGGMILTTLAFVVADRHLALFGRDQQGTSGLLMGWMTIVDAAATPLAGRIGDRRRAHGWVAAISLVFVIIGLLVIAPRLGVVGLVSGLAIVGLGSAGLGPSLLVVMGSIVPRERSGAAVGVMQLCGDVGGMLGPLVGTAILAGGSAYVAAAVLLALMLPLAINLAREEASPPESETLT